MKARKFYKTASTNKFGTSSTSSIPINTSAMYLIIVESPSKCKKIEEYLGANYQCIASKGHIRTIDGIKSIDTKNNYAITFSMIEEKKAHVAEMRKIIVQFPQSAIYLATDDDREGEAIAWHICDVFGLPIATTKRILFHEITKPAILNAVSSPTTINMSLVYAQHARQVLDVLVGYKISPTLWKHIHNNKKNGLSAGRCQTPALRLVYENEKSNKNEYLAKWKTSAHFFSTNTKFELTRDFTKKEYIEQFLENAKTHKYKLTVGIPKESVRQSPRPFNTSQLLQTASNVLHYSPKMTMDLCQQLYQSGFITYMRTDSVKYSPVFVANARQYIVSNYGEEYVAENINLLSNNDALNPHEAIRATNLATVAIDGDKVLQSMYRLIWKNTVESCMASAKYNITIARISAPDIVVSINDDELTEETKLKQNKLKKTNTETLTQSFEHAIEVITFAGWKRACMQLDQRGINETDEKNKACGLIMYLQNVANKGEPFTYLYMDSTVSVQHKHTHYTEASLIQKLEELGIGRPSTFATIVETIQERGYVKKGDISGMEMECVEYKMRGNVIEKSKRVREFGAEKSKLKIQPTGVVALEFLVDNFENLFSYGYTKTMEEALDLVAQSCIETAQTSWADICAKCMKEIKELLKIVAKIEKPTYPLNDGYELVFHQYGASLKRVGENGEVEYKAVKKTVDIDLERLKAGEYKAEDLMELKMDNLGEYGGYSVKLKNGKFGKYVEWNDKKISLKGLNKELDCIELPDVIPYITQKMAEEQMVNVFGETVELNIDLSTIRDGYQRQTSQGTTAGNMEEINASGIVRIFNANVSVRNGKYGMYIFYKTPSMRKPVFYGLKGYHGNPKTCEYSEIQDFVKTKHKATLP